VEKRKLLSNFKCCSSWVLRPTTFGDVIYFYFGIVFDKLASSK